MLKHIYIRNFVFIDTLELNLDSGVIMVTGETGAGKSIILGAIDAALGQKNSHEKIKLGQNEAEVILSFDIDKNQKAKIFLEENALNQEEELICIIRRVIYKDGKTRNFINGRPSNLTTLRELGELLLILHTQHENQILLNTSGQTVLLDAFANTQILLENLNEIVSHWKKIDTTIKSISTKSKEKDQRLDYLKFQEKELVSAHLDLNEIIELPIQHKALASSKERIDLYDTILSVLSPNDSEGMIEILHRLRQPISAVEKLSSNKELSELLNQAMVYIEELSDATQKKLNNIDINPEKLAQLESRMTEIHHLARKHQVLPEELPELLNNIQKEMSELNTSEHKVNELEKEKVKLEKTYQAFSAELTQKRKKASTELSKKVTNLIRELGMPTATLSIALQTTEITTPTFGGAEQIAFLIQANTNYPAVPLKKTASGGELARVSLALQTILAAYIQIPTLILDEIDVGVGGKISAMIGQQLRNLGKTHQVICVTHQPQIAASGHQHFKVEKQDDKKQTIVNVNLLNEKARIDEIARMLGGLTVTEHALEHAREMLLSYA